MIHCNYEFKPNYIIIYTILKRVITIYNTIPLLSQQSGPINAEANEAEPAEDSGPPSKKKRDSCALADLLGQTYTPEADSIKTRDDAVDEVIRYKEVKPVPLSTNPLSWWKEHEVEFPLLSTAGDIVTAQRSALTPEHVDQLLFLNKNLHVH